MSNFWRDLEVGADSAVAVGGASALSFSTAASLGAAASLVGTPALGLAVFYAAWAAQMGLSSLDIYNRVKSDIDARKRGEAIDLSDNPFIDHIKSVYSDAAVALGREAGKAGAKAIHSALSDPSVPASLDLAVARARETGISQYAEMARTGAMSREQAIAAENAAVAAWRARELPMNL